MMRRNFSPALLLTTAIALTGWATPGRGQVIINGGQGGIIINGNFIGSRTSAPKPDPGGPHLIEFFDGRQLHGTLESLDLSRREVTLQRPDADASLVIPTQEIRSLNFDAASRQNANFPMIQFEPTDDAPPRGEVKFHATVRFVGGDWLTGEVTSIVDNKVHLNLADGSALAVDRGNIEWIYFSKERPAECYEGPTSMSGWTSGGGWTYRDGALRTTTPTQIAHNFGTLPDRVEYQFEVDQGNLLQAFTITLHGRFGPGWSNGNGSIQCMVRANTLNVMPVNGRNVANPHVVDLSKISGGALDGRDKPDKSNPVLFQVFEDAIQGKLQIYVNGQKAGDWEVDKRPAGRNKGGVGFQPTIVSSTTEQSLAKVRVMPWDGRLPGEAAPADGGDHLLFVDGTAHDGKFVDFAAGTMRLRTGEQTLEKARDEVRMVRFQAKAGPVELTPVVANLRLGEGGELNATNVTWRDSKLDVRTRSGVELLLPVSAVTDLTLAQTPPALAVAEDILVFKDGDRIKGHLQDVAENQKVRWRIGESDQAVTFAPTHLAGVRREGQENLEHKPYDCIARFRNGDWLAGQFLTLDKNQFVLNTAAIGQVSVERAQLRAIYLTRDGVLPFSDGTLDDKEWLKGLDLTGNSFNAFPVPAPKPNQGRPWRSFDGAFSLSGAMRPTVGRAGGIQIGRELDDLPALVEVSFDISGDEEQIVFSAQLFSEAGNPGYYMHFHSAGMYIYDLNPGQRGRGVAVPQQVQFDGKIKPNARRRHLQIFANRDTGAVVVYVDGVLINRMGGKAGAPARHLGRGFSLSPQNLAMCTFANLWFGPWNGRLPEESVGKETMTDTAVLNNGDETQGTIEVATPESVKLTSDVGPLELPLDRITMIDFGGAPPARAKGMRLHLQASGVLTMGAYHLDKDTVACHSKVAGDMLIPFGNVREMAFVGSQEDETEPKRVVLPH